MKDELGRKVMPKFVGLRPKMYSYIKYNGNDDETTKYVIKQRLNLKITKNCIDNNEIILRSQERFRSEAHNMFTGKVRPIIFNLYLLHR